MVIKPETSGKKSIPEPPKITFTEVSFTYNKKNNVLDDISFVINSGSKVALVGQSGSGKSTIINLISRFYDPIHGQILINEENIKDISLNSLRSVRENSITSSQGPRKKTSSPPEKTT